MFNRDFSALLFLFVTMIMHECYLSPPRVGCWLQGGAPFFSVIHSGGHAIDVGATTRSIVPIFEKAALCALIIAALPTNSLFVALLGKSLRIEDGDGIQGRGWCDGTRARTRSNAIWMNRLFTRRKENS